jgi:photosystem II stability/assembly factor-like uncharacterized protein
MMERLAGARSAMISARSMLANHQVIFALMLVVPGMLLIGPQPAMGGAAPERPSSHLMRRPRWAATPIQGFGVSSVIRSTSDPGELLAWAYGCQGSVIPAVPQSWPLTSVGTAFQLILAGVTLCTFTTSQIAMDTSGTLYAPSPGRAVSRSTDGGATWSATGELMGRSASGSLVPIDLGIHALVATTEGPSILFADAGPDFSPDNQHGFGVARSDDGGTTWQFIGPSVPMPIVAISVHQDPSLGIVVAAGSGGLWAWSEEAAEWRKLPVPLSEVSAALVSRTVPNTLYAVGTSHAKGLYVSRDSGSTWAPLVADVALQVVAEDTADESGQTIISGSAEVGVLLSKDGGQTWTPLGAPSGRWESDHALLVADHVLFAGTSDGLWAYDMLGPGEQATEESLPNGTRNRAACR